MKKPGLLRALAAALLAAAAVVGYWWWRAPQSTRIKAGAPAPELALQSIGSPGSTRISQFRGRPVLLTMFVDTCPACVEVIGRLERLHREFPPVPILIGGQRAAEAAQSACRCRPSPVTFGTTVAASCEPACCAG